MYSVMYIKQKGEVKKMGNTKIRKQIYLDLEQDVKLKELANALETSEAELIRQAIDAHVSTLRRRRRNRKAWQAERAFIQEWMNQGPVSGGRTWRREDLYDR